MTTRLIIVRHGNTFGPNDTPTRVGITDLPLVESGLAQGRAVGRYLKQSGLVPDVIFTSELKRTKQTAEQAMVEMGEVKTQSLPLFNEIDYGPDENKTEDVVKARLGEEAIRLWDDKGIAPAGWKVNVSAVIEGWKEFADSVAKKYSGQNVMVVTSNGIARFAPHITGDFEGFLKQHKIKISTGAICIFQLEGGVWKCAEWNLRP
jgi:2,3-bisphosphoglycerate-dependent phosphoglycerate mutase